MNAEYTFDLFVCLWFDSCHSGTAPARMIPVDINTDNESFSLTLQLDTEGCR